MPPSKLPTAYKTLFQQVQQTLVLGQQRIEAEKVKIYWETGNLIHAHIKQHKDRAEYGARVVKQLAQDLRMEPTVLHRCVKFAQKYSRSQIVAARQQFSWSHYRKLIAVPDDQKRLLLEDSARRHQWSSRELAARIEAGRDQSVEIENEEEGGQARSVQLLVPKRETPYTYRIIRRPALGNDGSVGNGLKPFPTLRALRPGQEIISPHAYARAGLSVQRRDSTMCCPY